MKNAAIILAMGLLTVPRVARTITVDDDGPADFHDFCPMRSCRHESD